MVYSPVACMRVISVCWRAVSLGCFPLSCMVPLLSFAGVGSSPVAVLTHCGGPFLGYGGDVARIPGIAETRAAARSGKG